jgi:hypothetical protein
MNTGVIDQFLNTFTTYIDSGFGLLNGEVAFLATTLIVIDVTMAALFWASRPQALHSRIWINGMRHCLPRSASGNRIALLRFGARCGSRPWSFSRR